MNRLSPNYDTITVTVMEEESDSMRSWLEPKTASSYRPLTQMGLIPVVGCGVSFYRIIAGIVDVVSNVFKTHEPNTLNQRHVGVKNILRGILEIAPTAAYFCQRFSYLTLPVTPLLSQPVLFVAMILIPHITAFIFSGSSKGGKTDAPVSLSYDGVCVIELRPTTRNWYDESGWKSQLYKYGTRVRGDFV